MLLKEDAEDEPRLEAEHREALPIAELFMDSEMPRTTIG